MNNLKELEMQGCRTFVCPNLSIMEERCKDLNIRGDTIERSKNMAIEYFKKTYHKPHYSSARHVIPSIVYIVCVLEGEKRTKEEIAKAFGTSSITIRKWQKDVMRIMDIKELGTNRKFEKKEVDLSSQFAEIDKEGNMLLLEDDTIEMAKHLMSKYFKIESFDHHYPRIKSFRMGLMYTASIIKNDRRRQTDICQVLGASESIISNWHNKILRVLGLKIISNNGHTVTVLEEQYDS